MLGRVKTRPLLLLPLLLATTVAACKKTSDEDLIREKVRAALTAVNEKKAGDIVADAAEDFRGPRNIDLRETRRYITGYMIGGGWLRAFEHSLDVEVDGDTAHVDLETLLAKGNQIKSIEDVLPTNGSRVKFDLDLERRDGEWKFVKGNYKTLRWK